MTKKYRVPVAPERNSVVHDTHTKNQLAHKLLIELLAHQFAFPVNWIDTQKQLLKQEKSVRRFIEVGPTKVLTTIASRTAQNQLHDADLIRSIEREFLFIEDDVEKIYYQYEDSPLLQKHPPPASDSKQPVENTQAPIADVQPASSTTAPVPIVPIAPSPRIMPAGPVPDVDLVPIDVILSIVAQKLKKSFDQVPALENIRTMSGGKSTLQNELIGDLGAEFGDLPDGSEDIALDALSARLASGFSGQPGKPMKRLMDRFMASKMPGGFTQSEACSYLLSRWGLQANRQTAVLCFSVTMEPSSRLGSHDDAYQFLDAVVARYAKHAGVPLDLHAAGESPSGPASASATVQVGVIDDLKKDQNKYLRKQFNILAQQLGIDLNGSGQAEDTASLNAELLAKISSWQSELDEEFLSGVQGIFDARKRRQYSSWWNWVREDVHHLLHRGTTFSEITQQQIHTIVNRWTPQLQDLLQYWANTSNKHGHAAQDLARGLLRHKPSEQQLPPMFRHLESAMAPRNTIEANGRIRYTEIQRSPYSSYMDVVRNTHHRGSFCAEYIHLRSTGSSGGSDWRYHEARTQTYLSVLATALNAGLSFAGKTALITGAGAGSIGAELIRGLLAGGARVIATTSRPLSESADFFCDMYKTHGARGSSLIVLPFNQASKRDCEALVEHIYNRELADTGADIDFVIPFAAISERGRELDNIDSRSELAHRAMLTNLLRLLGFVKEAKKKRGYRCQPATVVLPLSPNHGTFGGDGLYSESKIGLETLFNRFGSETWSEYLLIVGAVIGWTRGTGLMEANNIAAPAIEEQLGVLTFTSAEMSLNILSLLSPPIVAMAAEAPVYADLSGGLLGIGGLKEKLASARQSIVGEKRMRQAILAEKRRQEAVLLKGPGASISSATQETSTVPAPRCRSNIRQCFPPLFSHRDMNSDLSNLSGMIDVSRTVVVVGFSELGPYGSSRTRWEMESQGSLSRNGLTEMAWLMGLIKHFDGTIKGQPYVGWVDAKTNEPVHEADFGAKYGEHISQHSGIRMIETDATGGYDPARKEYLQEVAVNEDLPAFDAPEAIAQAFKLRHGDKVLVTRKEGSEGMCTVVVRRGATFLIAKSMPFDRFVGGQLPTGWSPARYGIPEDIVTQVDPITLYILCCVCDAMYSAGIEDPFELYRHIHVTELAICIGTGVHGLEAMRAIYRDQYLDRAEQGDVLQECFTNSMAAWANMLLLGAAGPIKSVTGTCATAVEALDAAVETIQAGKARAAVVGAADDLGEEVSVGFASMQATANAAEEIAKGFLPRSMSRPTASSRAGFVEAAGAGVQIVMTAELALEMGLPVYAIIAYTQMAGDKIGRSVPAPGHGVLTAAREDPTARQSRLLELGYRRAMLEESVADINRWKAKQLEEGVKTAGGNASVLGAKNDAHKLIDAAAARRIRDAQWFWNGNLHQMDPRISPLRSSLAVWGLTIDDIAVASLHGTSTKANDTNESGVINLQMAHLGRSAGNPLLAVCQKYLTGHPKGAAGAWMLNGGIQILQTGTVPGNRNADDVETELRKLEHLMYPTRSIKCAAGEKSIKAFMLTSFGFGQKGGVVVGVTPRLLFATVSESEYALYKAKVERRLRGVNQAFQKHMVQGRLFRPKDTSAWGERESEVFLDPLARI